MNIFEVTALLSSEKVKHTLKTDEDGVTIVVEIPFERWEIELRGGKVVRVERFISTRDRLGPPDLLDLIQNRLGIK